MYYLSQSKTFISIIKSKINPQYHTKIRSYLINSLMSKLEIQRRNKFTYKDEESMREYTSKVFGDPKLRSFWEIAKQRGLFSLHTSESLRFHWKLMIKRIKTKNPHINLTNFTKKNPQININNNPPFISKNLPQQEIQKKQGDQGNNKHNENLDTEISDDVDEENFEDFKIFESKKIVEINQKKSKSKAGEEMGEEEINEIFENLCDMCGKFAGKRLGGEEVIKVLVSFDGDVQRTIKFFEVGCNTFDN